MSPNASIKIWLNRETARSRLQTRRIHPDQSRQWRFDSHGCLVHRTGRFFRVVGVNFLDPAKRRRVTQPIIEQPEVGTLCFLAARRTQAWWLLVQAKVEPGNVNGAQLAPTVQATESNYQVVHGGKPVPYLRDAHYGARVLYDKLQSEQNSRFLCKRNRNKVVRVEHLSPGVDERFLWLPVADILPSLRQSNVVNTDARSVLACWLLTSPQVLRDVLGIRDGFARSLCQSLESDNSKHSVAALNDWLAELDRDWPNQTRTLPLHELDPSWQWDDGTLLSKTGHALQVHHLSVQCATREVSRWDQPILATRTPTALVTVIGLIDGVLHLLLQARREAGNHSGFELTTTIQTDDWADMSELERQYADLLETHCAVLTEFENSEEGGRFDRCISAYKICWAEDVGRFEGSPFHRWCSLQQVAKWLRVPNLLTNELRSTLSALLAIGD